MWPIPWISSPFRPARPTVGGRATRGAMAAGLDGRVRGSGLRSSPCRYLGGGLLAGALSGCGGDGGRAREESVVPVVQPTTVPSAESAGAAETSGELLLNDLTDGDASF